MPTGFTANIEKNESFEDFVLGCARAFGACLHQRDEPGGLPRLREVSNYYEERLPEAQQKLDYLLSLTGSQIQEYGTELRDIEIERIQKSHKEKRVLKDKYMAMLDKVNAWNPPTQNHTELKEFMIKQITDSIEYDCNIEYNIKSLQTTISKRANDFYNEEVKRVEWGVNNYKEELEKEKRRVAESNDWIIELYKSLGISPAAL